PNLELEAPWKLDFAAMLLPLCDMIIPTEIEQKIENGLPLDENEKKVLKSAPETIRSMLQQIPRIAEIADIVASTRAEGQQADLVPLEAKVLIVLEALAKETASLFPKKDTFEKLLPKMDGYDAKIFQLIQQSLLKDDIIEIEKFETINLPVGAVKAGYTLVEDLVTGAGRLLLSAGTVLSEAHAEKLYSIIQNEKFTDTIKIMRPKKPS
ncbi:MAG: hypothetical protein OQJ97_16600, partial [Rhodospirillales bacterium]|nr:hypothetical protein [Rhodospirillales bacterium]